MEVMSYSRVTRASSISGASGRWIAFRASARRLLSGDGGRAALFRLRQKLSADDQPSHCAGALFRERIPPYFLSKSLLQPDWMLPADSAFLTRRSPISAPQRRRCTLAGAVFRSHRKTHRGHAGESGSYVHGEFARSALPHAGSRLAELAARIPHAWKLRNGRGKDIFIQALGDRLPPELLRQPKRGFGVPLEHWFRGSLRSFLWDHLTSPAFLNRGIVSANFVRYLLNEHDRGRRNNYIISGSC